MESSAQDLVDLLVPAAVAVVEAELLDHLDLMGLLVLKGLPLVEAERMAGQEGRVGTLMTRIRRTTKVLVAATAHQALSVSSGALAVAIRRTPQTSN